MMRPSLVARSCRRPRAHAALLVGLVCLAAPLRAQILAVAVTDTAGAAIEGAELRIVGLAHPPVRTAAAGTHAFRDLPAGRVRVQARRIGFRMADVTVTLARGDSLRLALELERVPQQLAGVRVIETDRTGFEERRRRSAGGGTFITRAEIDARTLTQLSELLRRAPSLDVLPTNPPLSSGRDTRISSRRARVGTCTPRVFLDGSPVEQTALGSLQLDAIQAIEIYGGGAGMPAQFIRNGSDCGAVVVWTRDQLPDPARASGATPRGTTERRKG